MALGGRLFGRKRERAQEGEDKMQNPPSPPSSPPRPARRSKLLRLFDRDRSASPPPPALPQSASYTADHAAASNKQTAEAQNNGERNHGERNNGERKLGWKNSVNLQDQLREKEAQRPSSKERTFGIPVDSVEGVEGAETTVATPYITSASPSPPLVSTPPYLPPTPPRTPTHRPHPQPRLTLPHPPSPQLSSSFPPPSSPDRSPFPHTPSVHPSVNEELLPTLPPLAYVRAQGRVLGEEPAKTIWRVWWEGRELIVKGGEGVKIEEAEWTSWAREKSGSNLIPQIYGVCQEGDMVFIYMEGLPGEPLSQYYSLNFNSQKAAGHPLVHQLSSFLRLLHSLPPPSTALPGGFGGKNLLALSVSADSPPSLSSAQNLVGWTEDLYRLRKGDMRVWDREIAPELSPSSLVCCHGDLSPRNILVAGNTLVGVIDYGSAGWYPPWVEDYGALGEWVEEDSSEGLIRFALRGAAARREGLVKLRQIILL